MQYEHFLENIRLTVQEQLGTPYQVELHRFLKNNGTQYDGLSILTPESPVSPAIYLNAYYEEAEKGLPLSLIAEQILLLYEEHPTIPGEWEQIRDFEAVKPRIVYKLINEKENSLLLSEIPHFSYHDLAIVFYIIISENDTGQMTSLVRNEHMMLWQISPDLLWELAKDNTPRLLPPRITSIESALASFGVLSAEFETPSSGSPISLYVLSNQNGISGAACILYPDVLKNFAARENDDVIILPSSIHEVLLTPFKKAFSYEDLNEMVLLINQSDVPPEDRLSNHVYLYSKDQDCVLDPVSPVPPGTMNPQ